MYHQIQVSGHLFTASLPSRPPRAMKGASGLASKSSEVFRSRPPLAAASIYTPVQSRMIWASESPAVAR